KRRKTCSIGTSFPRCGNLEQDGSRFHSRTPLISVSLGDGSGISDKTKLAETIQLLSNKDVSVTFLDTALAGICLIAMNQTNNYVKESALKKADLADVIKHAINVASSIALAQAEVQKAMYQAKTVEGTGGDKQNKSGEEKTAAERKISGQTVAATK
ncbi:hypothetical protein ACQUJZ_24940, partial [Ralstonia pseudosolanacearum]